MRGYILTKMAIARFFLCPAPSSLARQGRWGWSCLSLFVTCVSLGCPGGLAAGSAPHNSHAAVLLGLIWILAPAVHTDRELFCPALSGLASLCSLLQKHF